MLGFVASACSARAHWHRKIAAKSENDKLAVRLKSVAFMRGDFLERAESMCQIVVDRSAIQLLLATNEYRIEFSRLFEPKMDVV